MAFVGKHKKVVLNMHVEPFRSIEQSGGGCRPAHVCLIKFSKEKRKLSSDVKSEWLENK